MNNYKTVISETIMKLCARPKGILAADESESNIAKKFFPLNIENTAENRLAYRHMLFTTPGVNDCISGVILHEETFGQSIDGMPIPEYLSRLGIVAGLKVDKGLAAFGTVGEETTLGMEALIENARAFYEKGARFAKWRAVYKITAELPTNDLIQNNSDLLAKYAAVCLQNGIIPIIEPEVLAEGDHTIERCYDVTAAVLTSVFGALKNHDVNSADIILKPNMIVPGLSAKAATHQEIAELTVKCLTENVPHNVPAIVFLSGGQSEEDATENLKQIVALNKAPWRMTFSYGRALQNSAVKAWAGKDECIQKGQKAFQERMHLNAKASIGQ